MMLLMDTAVQNRLTVGELYGSTMQDMLRETWSEHTMFVIDLYDLEQQKKHSLWQRVNRHLQKHPHSCVSVNLSHESIPIDWLDVTKKARQDLKTTMTNINDERLQFMISQWDAVPNMRKHYPNANYQDVNFWELHTVQCWNRHQLTRVEPSKHILCLNRRYTAPRAYTVRELLKHYPDATYTLGTGGSWEKPQPDAVWRYQELRMLQDAQLETQLQTWQDTVHPWRSMWDQDDWEGDDIYRATLDHTHHIVVESSVLPKPQLRTHAFVTEKTFRPIVCSRRFYSIGEPHTNATLQRWGYRTYHTPKTEHWQHQVRSALKLTKKDYTLHNRRNLLKRAHWQHRYNQANGIFKPYYGLKAACG